MIRHTLRQAVARTRDARHCGHGIARTAIPCFLLPGLLLAAASLARAEVVRVEITGRSGADAPGYEEIVGRLHFEIDPPHPRNRVIADVDLAPVNAAGRVEFSSDLRILKPKEAGRGNGAAWVEIPNRGGKSSLSPFFTRHGFIMMQVGWQFDAPAQGDKLRIELPPARAKDGKPLRGIVRATFTPDKRVQDVTVSSLADYLPVDPSGPDSRLTLRAATAFPEGQELPRSQWRLEGQRVVLEGGFAAGKTYELAYLAEDPPVAGLGLAAIRDAVAWLKHDPGSLAPVRHAYAFGSSQCGRLLREFLYLGFNTDEQGRLALDGVMAHVAGAGRLDINRRWSTPRAVAAYETASYPFTDTAQPDPVSGLCEGIQENPRVTQKPKIFYTNTAAEYWGAGRVAALSHTTPDGARDVPLPENIRSYFFAGTQHGPAAFPPRAPATDALLPNPVSANPVIQALRLALHRWVSAGVPPPPSAYPKRSDGTLVPVAQVRFPALPGIPSPRGARAGVRLRNPLWPDGAGAGAELPLLVPQVDADGNDLAGIRMPDVSVPLGTCTGWVFRPASMGAPEELMPLRGSWVPFAAPRAQREETGDPRPALEERYASRDAFLARVSEGLRQLVQDGYLLDEDLEPLRLQAGERWDWLMSRRESPSAAASPAAGGYRGIWYGGKEYGGGFALFPSQHSPAAIYCAEAGKTFFVYGGTVAGKLQLQAMASYYDHQRDLVPKPTIVHDWGDWNLSPAQAADAHRNPVISLDGDGHVWVFVSGHGDAGFIYRARKPHSVENFDRIFSTPMTYPNPWWIPNRGFFVFFTKYDRNRESFWIACPDAKGLADPETWKAPGQLNAWTVGQDGGKPGHGLYQFTAAQGSRVATAMNNWIGRTRSRSNLFYLQSDDLGRTWQTAGGKAFTPPIREVQCEALVRDFWAEGLQVYIQHLTFDPQGRPAILFLTSPAGQTSEGPGGPRTWTVAHWAGDRWTFHPVTTSSHNFDCGSLSIEEDGTWRIIGPTEPGPQLWRTGGEIAVWTSSDQGATWKKARQLTSGSRHNHCYVRRPVNAHPGFCGLWADGDGNDRSQPCRLYFCTKSGEVRVLPQTMDGPFARPQPIERPAGAPPAGQ